MVCFDHVSCSYGNGPVIENVDLTIAPGEFVGIVGPSGSGKTTLLRAMLGSVKPVHGSVMRSAGLRVAYVPQLETVDWNFPVTVSEVVAMSRPQRSWWPRLHADEKSEIERVLEHLGLAGLSSRSAPDRRDGQSGIAIVLTTHDLNGLAAHLPRLICFNRTVVADGAPTDVLKPYFLERTYGAPMEVLQHGGMPVVLEQGSDELRLRLSRRGA